MRCRADPKATYARARAATLSSVPLNPNLGFDDSGQEAGKVKGGVEEIGQLEDMDFFKNAGGGVAE